MKTNDLTDESFDDAGDDIFEERAHDASAEDSGDEAYDERPAKRMATAPDLTRPIPGAGALLEEPAEYKVFKAIDKEIERQKRLARNREEKGKHWKRIKKGVQFSILEKSEDQSAYRAILPPGVEDVAQPIPNKVLDLSDKQVSQILVDPPLPNPKSDGDSERTGDAMDLSKRFLRADGEPNGTNDAELWREVLTMNRSEGSAFVFVWVDPTGGGWRPKQVMAHPQATDASNPLYGPAVNPETGEPVLDEQQQPILERSTDPQLRYVAEDDAEPEQGADVDEQQDAPPALRFVDHPAEAAREWLPKHKRMVLSPAQVRTLPPTAAVNQAHSVDLLMWETLLEAKQRFPQLRDLNAAQLRQLIAWKPKTWKNIVPEAQRTRVDGNDADGSVSDDSLVFWYHKFCRICPDYPDGAEIAVSGATMKGARAPGFVLLRDTLREDVETDDGVVPVLRDPPVAQFRALLDTDDGDPFGLAPISKYGGANEIRAHLYLAVLEDIDVRLHPNTYLPGESEVTREDMNRRDGTPIDVLTKDHMPIFEQRPQLPGYLAPTMEKIDHEMDTLANLSQTAQALDSSYSQSGEAKKVSIRQAKVQLAQDWQGFINGAVSYWKVKLQLGQAKLKTPQLVRISGENAAFKARHFVGADLLGVSSVTLQPGSASMMSPAEKAQYLASAQGQQWLDKDEAASLFRSAMSDDLGLPASPHEEHIDRQVADWTDGPPKGWEDAFKATQQFPQLQQQYQQKLQAIVQQLTSQGQDPATAQQIAQQQAGPAPVQPPALFTPFEPRENDEEPVVAKIHYQRLSKLMSSIEFKKQPASWRTLVSKRYKQSSYAAGVITVRQQQQQQQQQLQAQQAAQQPAKDPNAPPEYTAFIAAATKAVVAKAQRLLGEETSALAESNLVAQKPGAEHVPEEIPEAPAPDSTPLELAHSSMEAERDRGHEQAMSAQTHAQTMEQLQAKTIGQVLSKADRQATHQSGAPRPERPE